MVVIKKKHVLPRVQIFTTHVLDIYVVGVLLNQSYCKMTERFYVILGRLQKLRVSGIYTIICYIRTAYIKRETSEFLS